MRKMGLEEWSALYNHPALGTDYWQYQAWKDKLPFTLRTETKDYDLYGAYNSLAQPYLEADGFYHLPSRDPRNGRILKRPNHPTFRQALEVDHKLGYEPVWRNGEVYTVKRDKKFIGGVERAAARRRYESWLITEVAKRDASFNDWNNLRPKARGGIYIVKKGDTLYDIAKRNSISRKDIVRYNPQLKDINSIEIGDYINLGKGKSQSNGWRINMSKVGLGAEKTNPTYFVDNTMNPLDEIVVTAKNPYKNRLAKYIIAQNDATNVYRDWNNRLVKPRRFSLENMAFVNGELVKTNMRAIKEHKRNLGVTKPYAVIDKANNKMYYMQGDKTLEAHEITRGFHIGDGYRPFNKETPYYGDLPQQTGAGIFTVAPYYRSPYLGHEPMFRLRANGQITSMAIHSPASYDRLLRLNNGNNNDNKVSYGCISPSLGVVQRWYDNKLLNKGDSVYILPEVNGNYIYENNNGKLAIFYGGNNPLTYTAKGVRHKMYYNTAR